MKSLEIGGYSVGDYVLVRRDTESRPIFGEIEKICIEAKGIFYEVRGCRVAEEEIRFNASSGDPDKLLLELENMKAEAIKAYLDFCQSAITDWKKLDGYIEWETKELEWVFQLNSIQYYDDLFEQVKAYAKQREEKAERNELSN